MVCSPAALADSSKEVGSLGDLPIGPMKGATFLPPNSLNARQLNENWMWNIKKRSGKMMRQTLVMNKCFCFSFATTKPFGSFPIFLLSVRWLKPFISSKKMEAGELPKEVDGPFSRQFRKDEEGNSSKI